MSERRVVVSVNVRSAFRASFAVTLSLWGIAFVGVLALYLLGLVSGGLGGIEGFIASVGFTGFRFAVVPFLAAFVVFAFIVSAGAGVVAGLLCHLYNSLVPLIGGVEVRLDEARARRAAATAPREEHPRDDYRPLARQAPPTAPQEAPVARQPRPTEWPQRAPQAGSAGVQRPLEPPQRSEPDAGRTGTPEG